MACATFSRPYPVLVLTLAVLAGLFGLRPSASMAAGEAVLTIPGTGDSQDVLRLLAERFQRDNPDVTVEIPDSVGSTGGIRLVQIGRAHV